MIQKDIFKACSTVEMKAFIESRAFPVIAPENTPSPYVVYYKKGNLSDYTVRSKRAVSETEQADFLIVSEDYDQALEIYEAVVDSLEDERIRLDGSYNEGYDLDNTAYIITFGIVKVNKKN